MRSFYLALLLQFFLAHLSTAAGAFPFFEPLQPPRPFQVIAHRGQSRQAPENTRPALQHCIDDGLEWAEIDVRVTRDGQHILSYDANVPDNAGKLWPIKDHSMEELLQIDVGSNFAKRFAGEKLLSLRDCLDLCKGRLNLYLDCKAVNPEQLAQEILAAGMERQVVVFSSLEQLSAIRKASAGKVATMSKWRPDCGGPEWAVTNGLAAVEIDAPNLTREVRDSFAREGIKVQAKVLDAWDKAAMWERVITAGADWVQTDLPEELIAHVLWRRLPKRPVQISLHRGAGRYAPENTMPAFEKAIRMGVEFIEFDVRTTSDGKFFLLHDSRLDRTTDGTGPFDQITADTARQLSGGVKFNQSLAPVSIPSLDEFMKAFAGQVYYYFDAKVIPPAALAEALERHNVVGRTVVYQSPQYLRQLRAINSRIRVLAPLGKPADFANLWQSLKPYAVDADWDILSKDLIERCHAVRVKVFSDALGKHERVEDYLQAIEWGIDLIQTDHPLRVMRAIELWEVKKSQVPASSAGQKIKP